MLITATVGAPVDDHMTAAVLVGHGGPDVLQVRHDVPTPLPGQGEVRLRVTAAAVNNTDLWTRRGAYGRADDPDAVAGWRGVPVEFPRIQGADVTGLVDAVGEHVDAALLGRRVLVDPARYATGDVREPDLLGVLGSEYDGGFAEHVVVRADEAHDVTASPLADAQLASLPIAYGTATGMLERAGLEAGETVLVTGASGGVGLALVQLARARGAHVVALTSAARAVEVRAAGADATVDRDAADVAGAVRSAADGEVDVVADVVGGWVVEQLFDVLCTGGRWVTCGAVAGPVVRFDLRPLYLRRRRLIGSTMHTPAQFRRLVEDAVADRVDPIVARTYPLTAIHEAQADLEAGRSTGKLVLLPGS
jgi:NADPH:quinone reductase-like Zn-dependent oxidoreductase